MFFSNTFLLIGAVALFDFGHPWPQPVGQFSVGKAIQFGFPAESVKRVHSQQRAAEIVSELKIN